jgi:peptidoglycan/xylan/chitin deacetylase (PgdA/CDA1 family)
MQKLVNTIRIDFKKGKKCAATFSFDFDAISLWLGAFKQSTPTAISRGEFGAVAAGRLLDLLEKYNIKSTWFIPGHTIETYPEICRDIFNKGHEIGHHNYLHETPVNLSRQIENEIINRGIHCIRNITGEPPSGYRSPAWDLSPNTTDLLLEKGFLYDSSMMGHDYLPYKVRSGDMVDSNGPFRFGKETDLIELPVSWSLDDFPHFEFLVSSLGSGLKAGSAVLENWIADFDYMYQNIPGGVFILTCHPQIIGRGHRIMVLEKLIQHVISHDDVWIAQMKEIANACRSKVVSPIQQ